MSRVIDRPLPAGRWKPSPTVAGSIGLHCLASVGAIVEPSAWPHALGAIAANHAFLGAVGLWPRSTLLGPNLTRLPAAAIARGEIAITIDDGPDPEVTPVTLDLLDRHGARASFFCVGREAAAHPALCREIVRRGHSIENHSNGHGLGFAMLGLSAQRGEILAAQRILEDLAGRAPAFFRPPAGLRNPLLDPVLHELGLRLVSWTRRGFDTRTADPDRVAARLLRGLQAGDILMLHDRNTARMADGRPVALEVLPRVLERVHALSLVPRSLPEALRP